MGSYPADVGLQHKPVAVRVGGSCFNSYAESHLHIVSLAAKALS